MTAPLPNEREWTVSGSECCSPLSTCLLAWCIPCVLYGRTHHRVHKEGQLKDWSAFNGDCCGWFALSCCGCQWIIQMMMRGDVRKKYGLKGSGFSDCLCACCCVPCDLMQQDKEAELRENERAGLVAQQPNTKETMSYQQPQAQPQHPAAVHDPYAASKEGNQYHQPGHQQIAPSPTPAYGQPQIAHSPSPAPAAGYGQPQVAHSPSPAPAPGYGQQQPMQYQQNPPY